MRKHRKQPERDRPGGKVSRPLAAPLVVRPGDEIQAVDLSRMNLPEAIPVSLTPEPPAGMDDLADMTEMMAGGTAAAPNGYLPTVDSHGFDDHGLGFDPDDMPTFTRTRRTAPLPLLESPFGTPPMGEALHEDPIEPPQAPAPPALPAVVLDDLDGSAFLGFDANALDASRFRTTAPAWEQPHEDPTPAEAFGDFSATAEAAWSPVEEVEPLYAEETDLPWAHPYPADDLSPVEEEPTSLLHGEPDSGPAAHTDDSVEDSSTAGHREQHIPDALRVMDDDEPLWKPRHRGTPRPEERTPSWHLSVDDLGDTLVHPDHGAPLDAQASSAVEHDSTPAAVLDLVVEDAPTATLSGYTVEVDEEGAVTASFLDDAEAEQLDSVSVTHDLGENVEVDIPETLLPHPLTLVMPDIDSLEDRADESATDSLSVEDHHVPLLQGLPDDSAPLIAVSTDEDAPVDLAVFLPAPSPVIEPDVDLPSEDLSDLDDLASFFTEPTLAHQEPATEVDHSGTEDPTDSWTAESDHAAEGSVALGAPAPNDGINSEGPALALLHDVSAPVEPFAAGALPEAAGVVEWAEDMDSSPEAATQVEQQDAVADESGESSDEEHLPTGMKVVETDAVAVEVEADADAQVEVDAEVEIEVDAEASAMVEPHAEADATVEADVSAMVEAQVEVDAEATSTGDAEASATVEAHAEVEVEVEVEAHAQVEVEAHAQVEVEAPAAAEDHRPDVLVTLPVAARESTARSTVGRVRESAFAAIARLQGKTAAEWVEAEDAGDINDDRDARLATGRGVHSGPGRWQAPQGWATATSPTGGSAVPAPSSVFDEVTSETGYSPSTVRG